MAAWTDATAILRNRIDDNWYGLNLDEPYTSFITRDRLRHIWSTPWSASSAETPFSILCKHAIEDLNFNYFYDNLIQLISALVYVDWYGFTRDGPKCKLPWDRNGKRGLVIPCGQEGQASCYNDKDLPLRSNDIEILFSGQARKAVVFRDSQFQFFPIIIMAGTERPDEFCVGRRLPWESEETPEEAQGWYGQVSRVTVVPGYIHGQHEENRFGTATVGTNICPTTPRADDRRLAGFLLARHFDCGKLSPGRLNVLVSLEKNPVHHDHIMMHVAAFTVGLQFRILFNCAWGDLRSFLNLSSNQYPKWLHPEYLSPYNLLKEGSMIGSALAFLHKNLDLWSIGCKALYHMDLKPENILVLAPGSAVEHHPLGIWKVTDFGLSDFGSSSSTGLKSMGDVVASIDNSGSDTFRDPGPFQAPEAEFAARPSSQMVIDQAKADVWSVGCVLAHLLAYSANGPEGVQRLQMCLRRRGRDPDGEFREGYFYQCSRSGVAEVSKSLNAYLCQPHPEHCSLNGWYAESWAFVLQAAMSINVEHRWEAEQFSKSLQQLVKGSNTPPQCLFRDHDCRHITNHSYLDNDRRPSVASMAASERGTRRPSDYSQSPSHVVTRKALPTESSNPIRPVHGLDTRHPRPLQTSFSSPGARVAQPQTSSPASSERSSRPLARSSVSEIPTPITRQSGSISTVESSYSHQLSSSASPNAASVPPIQVEDRLKRQLKARNYKVDCLVMSPNGSSIVFSDRAGTIWCPCIDDITAPLKDLLNQGPVRPDIVHITTFSVMVHLNNREAVRHVLLADGNTVNSSSLGPQIRTREVRRVRQSTAGCTALEYPDTIEVLDWEHNVHIRHEKGQGDLIKDLVFDETGNYLYAISADHYWVWKLGKSPDECYLTRKGSTGSSATFQRPRILPVHGSSDFFIQTADVKEHESNILVVRAQICQKQILRPDKGKLKTPLHMRLDGKEVFAVVQLDGSSRNSDYTLQRWTVQSRPTLSIGLTPISTQHTVPGLNRNSFVTTPKPAVSPFTSRQRQFARVANHEGQITTILLH